MRRIATIVILTATCGICLAQRGNPYRGTQVIMGSSRCPGLGK